MNNVKNVYVNDSNISFIKDTMFDFKIDLVQGFYPELQEIKVKFESKKEKEVTEIIENDKKLLIELIKNYNIEKTDNVKYGTVKAFINMLKNVEEDYDIDLCSSVLHSLNDYLTTTINEELKFCAKQGKIDDFSTDILDCLSYFSKDKWFKLKMLNGIDCILDTTLLALLNDLTVKNLNYIITDVKNVFKPDDMLTEYKRLVFGFNIYRPIAIIRQPAWENLHLNYVEINGSNKIYSVLRNLVDSLNMNSFMFSNTNKIQRNKIIEVFFNDSKEIFTLKL